MKKFLEKRPKTIAFVQTRTGSTRFSGKVLKKINGKEIFRIQIERMKRSKRLDQIVVVTTTRKRDDIIVSLCKKDGIPYFRGSELDLLDRFYKAAKKFKAELFVRIPSDQPLVDPVLTDQVIEKMQNNLDKFDYVSNLHPPSFPDGLDVEILPFSILETAWKKAKKAHEREQCTPYIWDNPKRFRIGSVVNPRGNMFMSHRWTLDYPEDFDFFKAVYAAFGRRTDFLMDDVLRLLKKHPEIAAINKKYAGINWYRHLGRKLKTVSPEFYRNEADASS